MNKDKEEKSKPKPEAKSSSTDIRIYIDGLLHIKIPKDRNTKINSWIEKDSKIYNIEIWSVGHTVGLEYDTKELWCEILELLDKHI